MERRHSVPVTVNNISIDSDIDLNLCEIKHLIQHPIPHRNRKISHNSQRYVSLNAIPEEMLTNDDSKQTSAKTIADPAPDGGYGWVIVMASFFCNLTVDGICYTFGLFFNDFVTHFGSSRAVTALAGSLLSGCYMTAGVFVSGLTNRYGCRPITIAGSLISCVAFLVSTVAPNSFVLLLTYGIMGGVGFGLIYLPAIVTVGYYFTTKRAFATGIAVCGSGMGAFLFAPLCQWLLTVYDWKNALIILAGLILNCTVFGALMRPLNIVINDEDTDDNSDKYNNTEPGVQSNLHINHLDVPLNTTFQTNYLLPPKPTGKIRSVSETTAPVLEQLLSPIMQKTFSHSSQRSIFVPPMARKDVFYSGSTLNLKPDSKGDPAVVGNNNNVYSRDRKYSYKLSITSDSIIYEKKDLKDVDTDKGEPKHKDTFGSILVQIFDLSVLKKPVMILLVVANIFGMTGYYIPFVYITQHATTNIKDADGELVTPGKAALILSAIGISNVFGRLFFGWFSDKISGKTLGQNNFRITALTINNFCLLMSGISTILIPLWSQYWLLLIDCIFFGFFISSYMSLTSIILADLLGIETLSTTFGLISCFRGISSILGPPLAGALYDITGSFSFIFISAGLLLIISSFVHFFVAKYENKVN